MASFVLVLAGCGAATNASIVPAASKASDPISTAPARTSASPRPTARTTPVALDPADKTSLKGTGSKVGPTVALSGDYLFKDNVNAKPGCHWAVFLDGLDPEPLDEFTTDYPGGHTTSADEIGLELRQYTIRVVATKCRAWSVSLARP